MTVDKREVEQMHRMLSIMNGLPIEPTVKHSSDDHQDMERFKNIVSGMHGEQQIKVQPEPSYNFDSTFGEIEVELVPEPQSQPQPVQQPQRLFQPRPEASVTFTKVRDIVSRDEDEFEETDDWRIEQVGTGPNITFDVISNHTNVAIIADMSLLESAQLLTRLLNRRTCINNPKIQHLLKLESDYTKYRTDAAIFKVRAQQRSASGDEFRAAVAEDRFKESKDQAMAVKREIIILNQSL